MLDYSECREGHGFTVNTAELFDRPTRITGDIGDWLALFGQRFFAAIDGDERAAAVREVREALRSCLQGSDGTWTVDYVRLRIKAVKTIDGTNSVEHQE